MSEQSAIATATAVNNGAVYATDMQAGMHHLLVDEPLGHGGKNEGPSPGDLLCMALASCKAITLRMYVQRKSWEVESIKVTISLVKGTDAESGKNTFHCELQLTGNLAPEQQQRLLEIARVCPIDRLLTKESEVITKLV